MDNDVENRTHYLYEWVRPWNNEVAYVGRGQGRRGSHHKGLANKGKHPNKHLQNVFSKGERLGMPLVYRIVAENLTEDEVNIMEIEAIARIGRRDLKKGPLCNKTDGGEGMSNPSEETREKLRDRFSDRKWSEEVKEKIRQAHLGVKHSPERIRVNSESHKGEKHYMFGLHHRESTKKILSEQRLGDKHYYNRVDPITGKTRKELALEKYRATMLKKKQEHLELVN